MPEYFTMIRKWGKGFTMICKWDKGFTLICKRGKEATDQFINLLSGMERYSQSDKTFMRFKLVSLEYAINYTTSTDFQTHLLRLTVYKIKASIRKKWQGHFII